jgi:glycerol-3-phosphate acyltransferase PlsY
MSVYWLLLGLTAVFAYLFGSMDSMVLASNFVFRRNLYRLGDYSSFVSNFRRLYGIAGFLKLLGVELVKNLVPILIGSLLLGIRGHADAGRAFAGFVLVLGRLWPVFYGFRGSHGIFAMVAAAFVAGTSVGAAALVTAAVVVAVTRYVSLGAVAGTVLYVMVSVLSVDDPLLLRLALLTAGLMLLRSLPGLYRLIRRREPRLSFEEDITYKLDE